MYSPQPLDLSKQPIGLRQWNHCRFSIAKLPIVFNSHHRLSNRKSAIGNVLSLRKLEAFACALLSVLLSFLDAWIARHETSVFEGRPQVTIILDQRARDAVPDCASLARG